MIESYENKGFCGDYDIINGAPKSITIPRENIKCSIVPVDPNFIKHVNCCNNIDNALKSLSSSTDIQAKNQPTMFELIIEENFKELNQDQLIKLSKIFSNKAVVIHFMSKDSYSMLVYWKSKDIDYFLSLVPPKKITMNECKEVYGFVADFLVRCLCRNHLGIQRSCQHSTESNKIELNQLANSETLNILQFSAEQGDTKCVKAILNLEIFEDTPYQLHNAPTLALNGKHYESLLLLMEGNFTYPPFMDITKLPTQVQEYIDVCEELHEAVTSKNIQKIEEILKENPNRRHFYSKNNQSALKIALEKGLYNMYEILLSNDISFGPHEPFDRVFAGLSENDKTTLREIHFRCSKDLPESHMNVLMMNTTISHDDMEKEGKEDFVLRAYRFLNKNPNLNPILKVVAASKRFNIIFDFKRKSVAAVDPTAPPDMRGFFYLDRKICVGAKQLLDPSIEHETFGTLAHELCHYALNLTFENFAKPYAKSDRMSRQEFKEVFQFCQENQGRDDIIDYAFKESPKVYKAELIVRAAHLIAMYDNQPEKLAQLQDFYVGLFSYHTKKVIPAMIKAIPEIRREADVEIKEKDKKIFNLTRNFYISIGLGILIAGLVGIFFYKPTYVFDELPVDKQGIVRNAFVSYKNVSVQFKDLFRNDSIAYGKLTSDHITDMLDGVVLIFDDSKLLYLEPLVSFEWDGMHEKLKHKFLEFRVNFQGQNVTFKTLNDTAPSAFTSLTSNQIIDIFKPVETEIGQSPEISTDFFIDRQFLPEDAKLLLFEYQLGHNFRATDGLIIEGNQERFIQDRTAGKSFQRFCDEFFKQNASTRAEIFAKINQNSFFVTQIFDLNKKDFLFMYESFKAIIERTEKEKMFVLSSEAGAGKTVAFEHLGIEIKEMYPGKWVTYVDLKSHVELYKYIYAEEIKEAKSSRSRRSSGISKSENININNVLVLLKNILNLSQEKDKFEVKLFDEFFKSGNLVLVWNGYDEISPTYSDYILNLINFIHQNSSNVQYICTRPLYSDQLSTTFNTRPYQLVPLNANEKKEFLKMYYKSQGVNSTVIDQNIQKVEKIIQKLQTEDKPNQDFNTPLMLKLIADTHIDKLLMESGNTYSIYEAFVEKKIEIWLKKGGSAYKIIQKLILNKQFNIMDIYQKYAFLNEISLFTNTPLSLKLQKLQIMQTEIPKDISYDKISEMGVLYINGKNKFEFAHKTFAEFFIARYFIENIYNALDVQEEEAELRLELFFMLVKSHGEKQTVITDFMQSYLKVNKGKSNREFAPAVTKLLRTKFKKFLFRMLDTNYPKIFEFLIEFFSKDYSLLVDLLQVNQTETFYTAIFNPSYFALATNPEDIKDILNKTLNPQDYNKTLTGINQKGIFYYGLYFYEDVDAAKSHPDYSEFIKQFMYDNYWTFFQNIQNHLTEAEQKEMFSAAINPKIYLYYIRVPVFFHGFETFRYGYGDLWGRYEHLLSKNETLEALGDALVQYSEIYPGDKKGRDLMLTTLLSYIDDMNLDDSEIFEMFKSKNVLQESHYFQFGFDTLWTYISNHTTKEQRRQILSQDDKDDKNLYLYNLYRDHKQYYGSNIYYYYVYDFTPFKVLHRAFTIPTANTLNQTMDIYKQHFSNPEIQDLIMLSNDFLYYVVDSADADDFQTFVDFLKEVFKGYERKLKEYLQRKIKPTNLTIFQYVESFKELPRARTNWFQNLEMLRNVGKVVQG